MPRAARAVVFTCALASLAVRPPQVTQSLDQILAAYTAGDPGIARRAFAKSADFQRHRLTDLERLEKWLGAWSRPKAALLIEVVERSAEIAPAYTIGLLSTGQRYVVARPAPVGSSVADDAIERRWHLIGLAALQRRFLATEVVRYVDALQAARPYPQAAAVWDPRVHLARAVGQEQRCYLLHATARHDRVLAELEGASATPAAERAAAIECVQVAVSFLESAGSHPEVREEARIRAGFGLLQLGRNAEAQQSLEAAKPGGDRTLEYWRLLIRGRVADARDDLLESERSYREALAAFPDAHSAGIGLALALFHLQRDDDAEAAVNAVRQRSIKAVDPWDDYYLADARFLERWLAELRDGLR